MDTSVIRDALDSIRTIWNKQSKTGKCITMIGLSIPSYIALRQLYWFFYRKYNSLPPGPNGLPLLGFMTTMTAGTVESI